MIRIKNGKNITVSNVQREIMYCFMYILQIKSDFNKFITN